MSSPFKITAPLASSSIRGQLYRAAIVGAASLKGKEVAEMLNERNFPAVDVRLLDDDESIGQLEATGDEINFIQSVRSEQFEKTDFTFFAADAECTRRNWKRARDAGSAIIDLSGALEEEDGATVRSLWVERERGQVWQPDLQPAPCVVAHPAALTLALLLLRARKAGSRFEPPLQLSSSPHPSRVKRAWTSCISKLSTFCLSKPCPKMCSIRKWRSIWLLAMDQTRSYRWIRSKHGCAVTIESWLESDTLQPALMVLQPPVFHGHALAIYLQMEQAVEREKLAQALAGDHVTVAGTEEELQPSNVNTAGQGNILVSLKAGGIAAERSLVVGRHRQLACRSHHGGGMRREHDPHASGRKDPMKWVAPCAWCCSLPSPVADTTPPATL